MAITQVISTFPDAPNSSSDTPSEFDTKANAFVNHQSAVFVTEINTLKDQINIESESINNIIATLPDGTIDDTVIATNKVFSNNKTMILLNALPVNGGGNSDDPDLTIEPVLMTNHANTPDGSSYWHITSTFYTTLSTSANKGQIAIEYNPTGPCRAYIRSSYSSAWTDWELISGATVTVVNGQTIRKYADGRMTITGKYTTLTDIDVVSGSIWRAGNETLVYEDAFYAHGGTVVFNEGSSAFVWAVGYNSLAGQVKVNVMSSVAGIGAGRILDFTAEGTWK